MITVAERAQALHRAKQGLKNLHANPATTKSQLGAAREQLNLVYSLNCTPDVWDAVQGIECVVSSTSTATTRPTRPLIVRTVGPNEHNQTHTP